GGGVSCRESSVGAHTGSRSCERTPSRLRGGGARHTGRSGIGLPDATRRHRRDGRAGRPGGGAASVPRLASRGIPVSCPWRAGDEPPGAGRAHGPAGRASDRHAVARRPVKRRELVSEFRAAAPVRLDFAGGWTDVPPFSAREGGVVVNGCIDLAAHVELKLGGTLIRLVSEELGQELECADSGGLVLDGGRSLIKAGARMFPVRSAGTPTRRAV